MIFRLNFWSVRFPNLTAKLDQINVKNVVYLIFLSSIHLSGNQIRSINFIQIYKIYYICLVGFNLICLNFVVWFWSSFETRSVGLRSLHPTSPQINPTHKNPNPQPPSLITQHKSCSVERTKDQGMLRIANHVSCECVILFVVWFSWLYDLSYSYM